MKLLEKQSRLQSAKALWSLKLCAEDAAVHACQRPNNYLNSIADVTR